MVDRQSKEYYQQQLAQAQAAAWVGFSRGAGYPGAAASSSSHPGFTPGQGHGATPANPYENYMQQLQQFAGLSSQTNSAMFGGASNFLGNSGKEMTPPGFSAGPFGFPGSHAMAFQNIAANYHRPLPAHSPLPAHMKNSANSSSAASPLPAHMRSNPYQQTTNYHSLNSSPYALNPGAMNPNYLQAANMPPSANQSSQGGGGSSSSSDYMSQLAERTRQQFDNQSSGGGSAAGQFAKDSAAIQQARQDGARRSALLNGGSSAAAAVTMSSSEASAAFNQLQQLQAAYSQAATGLSSSLKESSKAKAPSNNNYSYYQGNSQTPASGSGTGPTFNSLPSGVGNDSYDQIAAALLNRFGTQFSPQLLMEMTKGYQQHVTGLNQSFQQQTQHSQSQKGEVSADKSEPKGSGSKNSNGPSSGGPVTKPGSEVTPTRHNDSNAYADSSAKSQMRGDPYGKSDGRPGEPKLNNMLGLNSVANAMAERAKLPPDFNPPGSYGGRGGQQHNIYSTNPTFQQTKTGDPKVRPEASQGSPAASMKGEKFGGMSGNPSSESCNQISPGQMTSPLNQSPQGYYNKPSNSVSTTRPFPTQSNASEFIAGSMSYNSSPNTRTSQEYNDSSSVSDSSLKYKAAGGDGENGTRFSSSSLSRDNLPSRDYNPGAPTPSYGLASSANANNGKSNSETKPAENVPLQKARDSPRLDTPPGINITPGPDESVAGGKHSLPVVPTSQPASKRNNEYESTSTVAAKQVDDLLPPSKSVDSPSPEQPTSAGPSPGQQSVSGLAGLASMTNKIKDLQSKIQSPKEKLNDKSSEENSGLKGLWKLQHDVQKHKPPGPGGVCKPNNGGGPGPPWGVGNQSPADNNSSQMFQNSAYSHYPMKSFQSSKDETKTEVPPSVDNQRSTHSYHAMPSPHYSPSVAPQQPHQNLTSGPHISPHHAPSLPHLSPLHNPNLTNHSPRNHHHSGMSHMSPHNSPSMSQASPHQSPMSQMSPHPSPHSQVSSHQSPSMSQISPQHHSPSMSHSPMHSPSLSQVSPHPSPAASQLSSHPSPGMNQISPHHSPAMSQVSPHHSPMPTMSPHHSPMPTMSPHHSPMPTMSPHHSPSMSMQMSPHQATSSSYMSPRHSPAVSNPQLNSHPNYSPSYNPTSSSSVHSPYSSNTSAPSTPANSRKGSEKPTLPPTSFSFDNSEPKLGNVEANNRVPPLCNSVIENSANGGGTVTSGFSSLPVAPLQKTLTSASPQQSQSAFPPVSMTTQPSNQASSVGQPLYSTPNLDRMEIKNSGIPGPGAVTWKRKSVDDSPQAYHQVKKRKFEKSSNCDGDVYQFDDEDKSSGGGMKKSKEEKSGKGPVYKYKNVLISRDTDSDITNDQSRGTSSGEQSLAGVIDDNSSDSTGEKLNHAKKKNKRPKQELWSVKNENTEKQPEVDKSDKSDGSLRKGPLWGLPIVPKPPQKTVEKPREKAKPPPVEPVTTKDGGGKVSVNDVWLQAFGASGSKPKKKLGSEGSSAPSRKSVCSEPEEKPPKSILDIPPEVRRKPRPNFGGLVYFSPDWDRSVRRHHERCKVPASLDSTSKLSPKILIGQSTPKKSYEDFARKDMVSPPDLLAMERERIESKAVTDFQSTRLAAPEDELPGQLPSIVETILQNRKKLRLAAKMGRMYKIPFAKEKKMKSRAKTSPKSSEPLSGDGNIGLLPTPGLPLLTNDTKEVLLSSTGNGFGNFRRNTLLKYLDVNLEIKEPKHNIWSTEVLESKRRRSNVPAKPVVNYSDVFGIPVPCKKTKQKVKEKAKEKEISVESTPTVKLEVKEKPRKEIREKFVLKEKVASEKEEDDIFAFSQEVGDPTDEENAVQSELGGLALDLLDDNPSWAKRVTIQNLVVWEAVEPVSVKKRKVKKKRSKKSGLDFSAHKKRAKSSRDVSRANSPILQEEVHDIEYTLDNVVQESNRWVIDKNAGETILQRASKMGYPDVVAYALDKLGMSVKEKDYAGLTPLHKAAFKGHEAIVRVLLQYGADPSSGVKGTRALHEGIEGGSRETVSTLLSYGADPLLHDYSGNMPIDLAEPNPHMKFYLYNLLSDLHGKPPNTRGSPPPIRRWNVSHHPQFFDPMLDARLRPVLEAEDRAAINGSDPSKVQKAGETALGGAAGRVEEEKDPLDGFVFEMSSHELPTSFQFVDRDGDYILYRELKEFAKRFGHHKADIRSKCDFIELKKSEFLKTSHCKLLDRRHVEIRYHEREEEDTIILVKVDRFVKKILNAETTFVSS